jgi:uncharacterized membrane protein YedE/YeeE
MPTYFTPVPALAGGALIGAAVLVLFLTLGRIAGVSGMIAATFRGGVAGAERAWRAAFLLGLIAGPLMAAALLGRPLVERSPARAPVLVLAGLAVGVGTGLANGCTSGHGVCGVSRLSRRSIVATTVFMAFGFLTASVLRHLFQA